MALGDPVKINLDSAEFLLDAETGVIIQSADRSVDSSLKEVYDASVGDVVGYVFFKFVATQDFNAVVNGNTGLAAAAPGVVLTLANDLGIGANKNGVNAGGLFTKNVKISHQGEDLRMVSGSTIQRANVPAGGS